MVRELERGKLVKKQRDGHYALTPTGETEAKNTPEQIHKPAYEFFTAKAEKTSAKTPPKTA